MRRTLLRGFTLIEILASSAIILALILVSYATFSTISRQSQLHTTTSELIQSIRLIRERTLASVGGAQHGVHFESDRYVRFKGSVYNPADPDNEVEILPSDLEIANIQIGGGADVIFDRITGATSQAGTVEVRAISMPSASRTVTILPSGQVGEPATVSPTNTRLTDTRHSHFDLGWSLQGATTLTITFSDWPQADVVYNIDMLTYFNDLQTSFDWQSTIDAYGEDQKLHIFTHALDQFNTILDVHRDRGFNTKAVKISIDGKDIVSYAADGTMTIEAFGGTMTQQ